MDKKFKERYSRSILNIQATHEKLAQKIKTRNNLLIKLTGTGAETLRTAALSLVYSSAHRYRL